MLAHPLFFFYLQLLNELSSCEKLLRIFKSHYRHQFPVLLQFLIQLVFPHQMKLGPSLLAIPLSESGFVLWEHHPKQICDLAKVKLLGHHQMSQLSIYVVVDMEGPHFEIGFVLQALEGLLH